MKKTLALLLASSALLGACGTTDESEATEEASGKSPIDAATAYLEQMDETADVADAGEEMDYGDVDDEDYFSIHYQQGGVEVENRLEDASELSGLYSVELPEDEPLSSYVVSREMFIDVKADGRATVLSYDLIDPTFKDEYEDESRFSVAYLDEQNELTQVSQPTPRRVLLASGFLVEKFGETQFQFVEYGYLNPHHNSKGEMALSSPSNPGERLLKTELPQFDGDGNNNELKKSLELPLDDATLTEAKSENVGLPFLRHDGGLLSVGQAYIHLAEQEIERIQKKVELGTYEDDQSPILFENNNELMHYLLGAGRFMDKENDFLADDPSEYYGYTEDNTEVTPEVVFLDGDEREGRALTEDGTLVEYHSWDENWYKSSTD